jgi:putative hemin transport protein
MVFVGNRGTIQIFSGLVRRSFEHERWYNVMDPAFNLHLDQERVAGAWVVKKPTEDGVATSLELYDGDGERVALLFGVRKAGSDGRAAWEALTESLS